MAVGADWRCPRDSGYWTRLSALNPLWYNSSPYLLLFQRALSFGVRGTTISRARLVSCCCRYYLLPRTTFVQSREWAHRWSSCIAPLVLTLGILISACICSSLFPFFVEKRTVGKFVKSVYTHNICRVEGNFRFHLHWSSLYTKRCSVMFCITGVHFILSPSFKKRENITVYIYTHTYSYAVHKTLVWCLRLRCVIFFTRTTHAKTVFAMFFFFFPWVYTLVQALCAFAVHYLRFLMLQRVYKWSAVWVMYGCSIVFF